MTVAMQHTAPKLTKGEAVLLSSQALTWTSNGAPNATEQIGRVIDRLAEGRLYLAAKLVVPVVASTTSTGGAAATLATVVSRVLHATASGGTFAAHGSTGQQTNIQNLTASASSTNYYGVHEVAIDLSTAARFIEVALTGTLVASSSGLFGWAPSLTFFSPDEGPAAGTILTATSTAAYTSTSVARAS